jgi:hypothetical protein
MGDIWNYYQSKAIVARVSYLLTRELEKLGHACEVKIFADRVEQVKNYDQKGDWSSTKFDSAGGGTSAGSIAIKEAVKSLNQKAIAENIRTKVVIVLGDGGWDASDKDRIPEAVKLCKKSRVVSVFVQYFSGVGSSYWHTKMAETAKTEGWDIHEPISTSNLSERLLPTLKRIIVTLERQIIRNIRLWEGR